MPRIPDVARAAAAAAKDPCVAQEYIARPFLIDGFKFDMRVYVLVTSCAPLRLFLYKEGLVRLCTEAYAEPGEANADQLFVHLTNFSINKRNEAMFETSADGASG
ncbi:tubulin-tyrosine ligase family-domain-containing protein [Baffinella frigidus]|nr:tubulin-tyrosine ligase family-domain-containing protein [Cryptophyta sp. CCMP2293]